MTHLRREPLRSVPRGRRGPTGAPPQPVWTNDVSLSFLDGNGDPIGPPPKNLLGPEGPAGDFQNFETLTRARASVISPAIPRIRVARAADGEALSFADYIPGTSAGPGAFQDVDGNWRELDLSGAVLDIAWFGASPFNSDTTNAAAIQRAINALPAEGGFLLVRGHHGFTAFDLSGRRNISLIGFGSEGAGADVRSGLFCTSGAIGTGAAGINCRHTIGVGFRGLFLAAISGAFNGRLVDYGGASPIPGQDSAYMTIDDCNFAVPVGGVGLSLYGATNGRFGQTDFSGAGRHILLQDTAGTGFCNDHEFSTCTFHPGSGYPVLGSGEGIDFLGCCFQAGSDGIGRAVQTSDVQKFKGLNFTGCTFYDQRAAGGEWIVARWGGGFNVTGGCRFGGIAGSYGMDIGGVVGSDPQEGGVRGFNVIGNFFDNFTAAITFSGTSAAKSNARGGLIGGNCVTNGNLLASYNEVEQTILMPASIYGAPNEIGSNVAFLGLPSYANDLAAAFVLTTGQLYRVGNAVHIV